MKILICLSLVAIFCLTCKKEQHCAIPHYSLNRNNWAHEYLPFDSVLINGMLPIVSKKADLIKILGSPDTIFPLNINRNNFEFIENGTTKNNFYFVFGKTKFECFDDMMVLNTVDFESTNLELIHPKITLKKSMSHF